MSEQFDKIEGLQLWTPSDSFETPLNKIVFENLLARLHIVDVQFIPGEENIYCLSGGMAYEAVTPLDVTWRSKKMTQSPLVHCFQPDLLVENVNKEEEARARELQLALARTSLKAGIFAEGKTDYEKAVKDLIEVFRDVKTQIHTKQDLEETELFANGNLLKAFIESSNRYKTVTPMQARTVASMLGRSLLPAKHPRTKKMVSWESAHGYKFAENLTSKQPAKKTPKVVDSDQQDKSQSANSSQSSEKKQKKRSPESFSQTLSYEERFYAGLRMEGFPRGVTNRRAFLKNKILVEGENIPLQGEAQKIQTVRLGISAYLEKFSEAFTMRTSSAGYRNASRIANETLEYIKYTGGKKVLRKILTIGNLFAAKTNVKNKNNKSFVQTETPGIDCNSDSLLKAFKIVRSTLVDAQSGGSGIEPEEAKDIAEILEAYIKSQTFDYNLSELPRFNMRNDSI